MPPFHNLSGKQIHSMPYFITLFRQAIHSMPSYIFHSPIVGQGVWALPPCTVLPEAWSWVVTVSDFGSVATCARFGSSPLPPQTAMLQSVFYWSCSLYSTFCNVISNCL